MVSLFKYPFIEAGRVAKKVAGVTIRSQRTAILSEKAVPSQVTQGIKVEGVIDMENCVLDHVHNWFVILNTLQQSLHTNTSLFYVQPAGVLFIGFTHIPLRSVIHRDRQIPFDLFFNSHVWSSL